MPRPISESDVLHHAAKELPDESVIERVRAAIGMPPKSKTFYMLTLDLIGSIVESEDVLVACLDALYARKQIDITNGWIHGIKMIDTSDWTVDDWDWVRGTGRFAQ